MKFLYGKKERELPISR